MSIFYYKKHFHNFLSEIKVNKQSQDTSILIRDLDKICSERNSFKFCNKVLKPQTGQYIKRYYLFI